MILNANGQETSTNPVSLTERQMKKQMALNATIGDVNEIAHQHAVRATNHLGNQIPGLIHKVVGEAIQGFYESLRARGMLLEPKELGAAQNAAVSETSRGVGSDAASGPEAPAVDSQAAGLAAAPTDSEGAE